MIFASLRGAAGSVSAFSNLSPTNCRKLAASLSMAASSGSDADASPKLIALRQERQSRLARHHLAVHLFGKLLHINGKFCAAYTIRLHS